MFISPFHMHLPGTAFPPHPNCCLDLSVNPNSLAVDPDKNFLYLRNVILKKDPFLWLFNNILGKR